MKNPSEKQKNVKQLPFRLHANDKALFFKMLSDKNLNFQSFVNYCMQAFMSGDPAIMKVLKDWKALSQVPKDYMQRYTLSNRERELIQQELETLPAEDDVDPREAEG